MTRTGSHEWVSCVNASPVKGLRYYPKADQWRVLRTHENISSDEVFRLTCQFVKDEAENPVCVSVYGKETTCTCLHILRGEENSLRDNCAYAIQHYHELKDSKEKTCHFVDLKRHADAIALSVPEDTRGPHCKFLLPCRIRAAGMADNDTGPHFLCTWGILRLFAIGKTQWTRLRTCNSSWETKLIGNKNANKRMEDVFVSIDTFLTDLKVEADPMATRIVRAEVGLACRGDTDAVKLAPHFKYRKIYESWVLERGWVTKLQSRDIGNYSPASEFGVRPHDDESDYPSWPTGSQQKDICSFRTFMRQWGKTHPELRIRPRGEDTCTQCWQLMEDLHHKASRMNGGDMAAAFGQISEADLEKMTAEHGECLTKCTSHIRLYKAQRELLNEHIAQAKADHAGGVSLDKKTVCITTDMMQNAAVPWLGSEQVGISYYFSAMTQMVSGFADNATEEINCYVWQEGVAGRGANEIVSCFYLDLERRGYLEEGSKIGHLVLAADNCSGQNKNKTLIRFCNYLREVGFATDVTLLFLVKGHTKNLCDRMFNLVKHVYHDKNIYSTEELDMYLSQHPQVDVLRVPPHRFRQFEEWFHNFYVSPKIGTSKHHVYMFHAMETSPTIYRRMTYKYAMGEDVETHDLRPSKRTQRLSSGWSDEQRRGGLATMYADIAVTKPPGVTPIKQNEMFKKWRTIVPRKYWESTCPRPTANVMAEHQKTKDEKDKKRKASKAFAAKSAKDESEQEAEMLQDTDEVFGDMYEPVQVFGTDGFDEMDLDYFNVDGLDFDDLNVDNFVSF